MKYYYTLWSDAINWSRSSIRTIGIWKLHTLGIITLSMSINLGVLSVILQKLLSKKIALFYIELAVTNSQSVNRFLGAILLFYMPPLLLNYFLIFNYKKWDIIRKKYPHRNGKIYKGYVFLSFSPILILFIVAVLYKLMNY